MAIIDNNERVANVVFEQGRAILFESVAAALSQEPRRDELNTAGASFRTKAKMAARLVLDGVNRN